jgi:hypothetical protein
MKTFADKVIEYNRGLEFSGSLPNGIRIMNPFREDENVLPLAAAFYQKYYNDTNKRFLILGINPGRFGGGVTGIPFTDTKRLVEKCALEYSGKQTHEPSSVFIYEMIDAYGGVENFYKKFYINSICPLGFTAVGTRGKEVNYNYYDSRDLTTAVYDFIRSNIQNKLSWGLIRQFVFVLEMEKMKSFSGS